MAVPSTQVAAVISPSRTTPSCMVEISRTHPVPAPGSGELLIKLEFSGVCHSDLHSIRGDTPMSTNVAGHEGVGKVVDVGAGVDEKQWIGQRVGIRWLYSSCLECEICAINHTACPNQKNAGADVPGTFQQYIVSPAIHVTRVPPELSPELAAPLLCAGIAMYSSIIKTKALPGDWLVIPGAGGGLGHMGVQIAAKKGLKVLAIDKRQEGTMPVAGSYRIPGLFESRHRSGCQVLYVWTWSTRRDLYRQRGASVRTKLANAASSRGTGLRWYSQPSVQVAGYTVRHDVKGLTIVENSAGTAKEMEELIALAVADDITAHVEVFDLADTNEVLQRLERSEIEGRVVLRIPD